MCIVNLSRTILHFLFLLISFHSLNRTAITFNNRETIPSLSQDLQLTAGPTSSEALPLEPAEQPSLGGRFRAFYTIY